MSNVRLAAVLVILISGTACGGPGPQVGADDLLLVSTSTGVASIKAGGSTPTFRSDSAVPAGDWSTVVHTQREGNGTAVVGVDPATGQELWKRTTGGNLRAKVVAPDGAYVALAPAHERYEYQTRKTTITITGRDVDQPKTVKLAGNFEPEAFSTDGKVLFVVQYLPAATPRRYQVRQLDVATGRVSDVFSVDKELQEAMRGTARVQEMSSDGKRLYTLYSTRTRQGEHSFIHVLSLDELWAHCIDLPHGFAMGGDNKTAVTVRKDGERLYVADTSTGAMVEVDTERLEVLRHTDVEQIAGSTGATLRIDEPNGALYLGTGNRVVEVALDDLGWKAEWRMPNRIRGLQVAGESGRLYVGSGAEIGVIDIPTGDLLEAVDPPGVERIDQLGPVTPGLDPARREFTCAC